MLMFFYRFYLFSVFVIVASTTNIRDTSAMTIDYINTFLNDSTTGARYHKAFNRGTLEAISWLQKSPSDIPVPDSIQTILEKTFRNFKYAKGENESLPHSLLASLVLLRLYESGIEDAYTDCLASCTDAFRKYPQNVEFYWIKGLLFLKAGLVIEGIRLMDSLQTAGFDNREFAGDYAKYALEAFIPGKKIDTNFFRIQTKKSGEPVNDTVRPNSVLWKVISAIKDSVFLPSFMYGATFIFSKPAKLHFQGLVNQQSDFTLFNKIKKFPGISSASGMLPFLRFKKEEIATCRICIDLTDIKSHPIEYLKNKIDGFYDSIEIRKDLRRYNAISLRCYTWGNAPGNDGTYTAYITFDRMLGDLHNPVLHRASKKNIKNLATVIRFTLVIQSSLDVQSFTEAKLQTIIAVF
jgi:hypothetical protein